METGVYIPIVFNYGRFAVAILSYCGMAQLVRTYLSDRPNYNSRLRAKLLQAADGPFRASTLLYP